MSDLFAHARAAEKKISPREDHANVATSADKKEAARVEHQCEYEGCGRFGMFGFGVSQLHGRRGRWACFAHREEVKALRGEGER